MISIGMSTSCVYPLSTESAFRLARDAGFDGIELNYDLENDLSPARGTAGF